jgi:hypothetical protein
MGVTSVAGVASVVTESVAIANVLASREIFLDEVIEVVVEVDGESVVVDVGAVVVVFRVVVAAGTGR